MNKITALLIDDDYQFGKTFQMLSKSLFQLSIVQTSKDGLRMLEQSLPDVVFLDYKLNENKTGLDVLQDIRKKFPELPVVIITEHEEIDLAVQAMRLGAIDFISKSPNIQALRVRLEHQIQQNNWKLLCHEKDEQLYGSGFIAQSPVMQELMKLVRRVAQSEMPVLIQGETGTGKTVLAREIHRLSPRREFPFVALNCSNLPANLFESELFGHTKGAFTGAERAKRGKLELADQGTLFLDEIGALPPECQAKILTAIDEKSFSRLGAERNQQVNIRIIAATNSNLEEGVKKRTFREDLFYRLNVVPLTLPPLKERPDDIQTLAEKFLSGLSPHGKITLSEEALKTLRCYNWPGNVRELRNTIQRSALFCNEKRLTKIYLNADLNGLNPVLNWQELLTQPYENAKQQIVRYFQKYYFENLLQQNDGNISRTAEAAGINRTTLHRFLNEFSTIED